jgi:hypothetical protein
VATGRDRAAAAPRERQIEVRVLVSVGDAVAVHGEESVEEAARALAHAAQSRDKVGELLEVEAVDAGDLRALLGVAAVVRRIVVAVWHAGERVAAVAALAHHQERNEGMYAKPNDTGRSMNDLWLTLGQGYGLPITSFGEAPFSKGSIKELLV